MTTIRVFDPAMCCSTGVCGPSVDQRLIHFTADLDWLKSQGVAVERFNLSQQPAAFVSDPAVREALETRGEAGLPLVKVDGVVKSIGVYPPRQDLDAKGRELLAEDLRSPCIEEIAVFRAFAETVAQGEDRFVIIDTAPTGHTLLLLDAAESYHREVLKRPSENPEAVQRLLPRLRDADFTHVLLVTLPEATPIHEAMQLERDLARADIKPFAWVVNQSLTPLTVTDPVLRMRRAHEATYLRELAGHSTHIVLEPWSDAFSPRATPTPVAASASTAA